MASSAYFACPSCATARAARDLVFADSFSTNSWYTLLPFVVVVLVVRWSVRRVDQEVRMDKSTANPGRQIGPLVAAGLVLGIGLGGFVDGILLHQILQWHNMLSAVVPPTNLVDMKYNMVWDGLFHALTWTMCAAGVGLLFRAGRREDVLWSGRILAGSLVGGWGLFNFVEGLIDHQLLGIHHVHPGDGQLAWDMGFVFAGGAGPMLLGTLVVRRAVRAARTVRGGVPPRETTTTP